MNLLSCLLPDATHVRLETWALEPAQSTITLNLHARQTTAQCPFCGKRSKRTHSRYRRTLADLPWGEYAVTIQLSIRRLFCDNAQCGRRLFAERLPGIAAPWARKTTRLTLLQNLAEALEVVFADHAKDLRAAEQACRDAVAAERGTVSIPPAQPQARTQVLAAERRDRRATVHEQVWALRSQGWSGRVIARHLGISRATVFRHLRSELFPERKRRRGTGRSLLDPWQHVVFEHWNNGHRHGRQLFSTLQKDGCRGSYPTLARHLQRLRAAQGTVPVRKPSEQPRPMLVAAPRPVLTSRTLAWLVLRRSE